MSLPASAATSAFSLSAQAFDTLAAALFALAVLHTFSTRFFERLAHRQPRHAGLWHLLGEVEVVFGFWALWLIVAMWGTRGGQQTLAYLNGLNFTEPLFVFVIMVMAATAPVLRTTQALVTALAARMPMAPGVAQHFLALSLLPLLGAFITEPAAMTVAALVLRQGTLAGQTSVALRYGTLGVLFVNISIGGTLTAYAAPPVLMVADAWGWTTPFMMAHFGWRAALAVLVNAAVLCLLFRRELARVQPQAGGGRAPVSVVMVHLGFMCGAVLGAHHPVVFLGLLMFFLGYVSAYRRHQTPLLLREALLVAFFLAGLVVLGQPQRWWLQPLLMGLNEDAAFWGAVVLTAVTDNAALTYLGSLVEGLSDGFKLALVAGAVTGGGLTVIANAPNPAGLALLRERIDAQGVRPGLLFLAALGPTLVAALAFRLG